MDEIWHHAHERLNQIGVRALETQQKEMKTEMRGQSVGRMARGAGERLIECTDKELEKPLRDERLSIYSPHSSYTGRRANE